MSFDPANFDPASDDVQPTGGGGLPPEGRHLYLIETIHPDIAKSGNPLVVVDFLLIDPDHPRRLEMRHRFENFVLTKTAVWKYTLLCQSVLIGDGETVGRHDATSEAELHDLFCWQPVALDIVHENDTYQGRTKVRAKIQNIELLTTEDEAALEEVYGQDLVPAPDDQRIRQPKDRTEGGSGTRSRSPSNDSGAFEDDEIPF